MENKKDPAVNIKGFQKDTELKENADYRGIAGSASFNAEQTANPIKKEGNDEHDQDLDNPLTRGI